MEEIYSKEEKFYKITKARKDTVKFLLAFSASMQVVDYKNIQFETILN